MITIQEAHRYLKLVDAGVAKVIRCENDTDHPDLVSWLNEKDEVEFICLACSFKLRPGYKMVRYIQFVLENFSVKN